MKEVRVILVLFLVCAAAAFRYPAPLSMPVGPQKSLHTHGIRTGRKLDGVAFDRGMTKLYSTNGGRDSVLSEDLTALASAAGLLAGAVVLANEYRVGDPVAADWVPSTLLHEPLLASSYAVVFTIAAWSGFTKLKTGVGLPSGPRGMLGLAESLSVLSVAGLGLLLARVALQ